MNGFIQKIDDDNGKQGLRMECVRCGGEVRYSSSDPDDDRLVHSFPPNSSFMDECREIPIDKSNVHLNHPKKNNDGGPTLPEVEESDVTIQTKDGEKTGTIVDLCQETSDHHRSECVVSVMIEQPDGTQSEHYLMDLELVNL